MPPDRGYPRALNAEERNAIARLRRLAESWPQTLTLFSAAGSLCVVHTFDPRDDFAAVVKANIDGIPNDGGDPW